MMGESDYVAGLEPGNWLPLGRAKARETEQLEYIKPGETRHFHYEIGVVNSEKDIREIL